MPVDFLLIKSIFRSIFRSRLAKRPITSKLKNNITCFVTFVFSGYETLKNLTLASRVFFHLQTLLLFNFSPKRLTFNLI